MKTILETNNINVRYTCDVCVCGGGVAGITAAVAAARSGAETILIEKSFMLGGLATAGLITIYLPLCDGEGEQVSFGLAEELLKLSVEYGVEARYPKYWFEGGTKEERKKQRYEIQFNPQLFAISAEQLLRREGVKILYGTSVCAVNKTGDKISELIIESKSGREAISVKSVVDATGDADVCALSGENTETFKQGNVLASWYYCYSDNKIDLIMKGYADTPDEYKNENTPKPLVARRFSGLDGEEISEMVQLSHDFIIKDLLEKREKKGTNDVPVTIPTIPQIRMTRRICGLYTMNDKEIRKDFEDSVGMFSDWRKRGPVYQLPFRALYGSRVANLITAGRCVSSDDSMWDITRVIPVCAVTGEAAGLAAAMSDDFKALDVSKLQKELILRGVKIR